MKILVIFENYGPYHVARVRAFAQLARTTAWEVQGLEFARRSEDYDWVTNIENEPFKVTHLMKNPSDRGSMMAGAIRVVFRQLKRIDPDCVAICGYRHPIMVAALIWAVAHKRRRVLMSASKYDDDRRRSWSEFVKSLIVKRYGSALVGGKPQSDYLVRLGMKPEKIFYGYNVVEIDAFAPDRIRNYPDPVGKPFFLAVNRFIPKKNLMTLIASYEIYRRRTGRSAWKLVLCGDGPLREEITAIVESKGLTDDVFLPGFLQQGQLLPYFAHAKYFVHTSTTEQWGLVINEAMAAGLPIVMSRSCGCFGDLIREGMNGYGFDPMDTKHLADLMIKMAADGTDLERMGAGSLEISQKYSPEYFAQGLKNAIEVQYDR